MSFRVFHMLQVAHGALFRAADKRSRRTSGLTTTQLAVLVMLRNGDGLPITEIAATLAMGKSSLTGLVDRLCEKRLVRRCPSPADGRITLIQLEPAGYEAAERSRREVQRYNEMLLEPFSAEERDVIRRFLQHLVDDADTIINGRHGDRSPTGGGHG